MIRGARPCPSTAPGAASVSPGPAPLGLSGCDGIRGASAPFSRTSPHLGLLLSGVTPLSTVFRAPSGHVAAFEASSPISRVIPLQLLQTLNLHRWNCNVLRGTRNMIVRNYVRLFRASPVIPLWPCSGPAVARHGRSRLPAEPGHCLVKTPCARRTPQTQRKRGPAPADPRLNRSYS